MAIICEKLFLLFVKNNSNGYYLWKIIQLAIICEKYMAATCEI